MDGILYKGRMISQDGARPLTSVEKELAGERSQDFLGGPVLDVLALLGSLRECRQGSELAPSQTGTTLHSQLQKLGSPVCQALYQSGGKGRAKKDGLSPQGFHTSGRSRLHANNLKVRTCCLEHQ